MTVRVANSSRWQTQPCHVPLRIAGRRKPSECWVCQPCYIRVAGRQSSEYPSHLGRSRSVRAPVDGVAGKCCGQRQTVHPVPEPHGPVSCRAVTCPKTDQATFILAARRPFLAMFSNLARTFTAYFQPVGSSLEPGFIGTLRRSPPEVSNTSVRRSEALDSVHPKEAPRKCGARVKWSDQEQNLVVVPQGLVLVIWEALRRRGARLANEVEFHIRTNPDRRLDD